MSRKTLTRGAQADWLVFWSALGFSAEEEEFCGMAFSRALIVINSAPPATGRVSNLKRSCKPFVDSAEACARTG